MSELSVYFILFGIVVLLIVVQVLLRSKKPVRKALLGVVTGIASLVSVNLMGSFTNVTIPISLLSLSVSAIAGIPGVTTLLILRMIVI